MYFDGPTETDMINQLVKDSTDLQNEKLIRKFIEEHDTSEMEAGVDYYFNNSDIRRRLKYYYDGAGVPVVDETKPNNKIPHGFAKLLVDQKVAYVAGKPVTFDSEDEQHIEALNELLGEDFDDALNELS